MSLQLWQKKKAIIAAMNKGYLLDVSGNPVTLTNALNKPLAGVTVYGASGGVGDSDLPSGYVRLEYIESTGTQYIDTGFVPNNNTRVTAKLKIGSLAGGRNFAFGAYNALSNRTYSLYAGTGGGLLTTYNNGVLNAPTVDLSAPFEVDKDKNTTTINGESVINTAGTFTAPGNMLLFGVNDNGTPTPGVCRIYSCKIYDNGTLVRSFMPAKRSSDDVVGLYDVVNDVFYINGGTGDFVAGGEIYKIPVRFGDVPAGYTQLEYIESTGTQYIDTGVVPLMGDESSGSFMLTRNETAILANAGKTSGRRTIAMLNYGGSGSYYAYFSSASATLFSHIGIDVWLDFSISNDGTLTVGNVSTTSSPMGELGDDDYLTLFARPSTSQYSYMRLAGFAIARNGSLVRNFIPAKRNSDGVVGMYDTVTGTFYTNAGTGSFIAGAEVPPNKTINLYTDAPLIYGDDLRVDTAAKTAYRGTADVSAMQDWEQDFTLAKGDNTVSIGTTVAPSAVEWQYWSSKRATE